MRNLKFFKADKIIIAIVLLLLLTSVVFGYSLLIGRGDSMEPTIKDGCTLHIIHEYNGQKISEGEIVGYERNDRIIVHRLIEKTKQGYVFKGDANNMIDQPLVEKEQIRFIHVYNLGSLPTKPTETYTGLDCYPNT